jgi:hypothetical protein
MPVFSAFRVASALLVRAGLAVAMADDASVPAWQPWSDDLFARAKAEHRLVLLDLEAGWCHWCHVMDETTYRDPAVTGLLAGRFLPVRVDQDARPDLSNRYEDYGWPATVVFDADGHELVKRSGYLEPRRMAELLQAIVDDPTPGPSVVAPAPLRPAPDGPLDQARRERLRESFLASYDREHGAWGTVHKYLDPDCVEYCLLRAAGGAGAGGPDREAQAMVARSLDAAMALFDPAWGGVYQYSTGGVWSEPHFEKLMAYQADYLRSYALDYAAGAAGAAGGRPARLRAAEEVQRFMRGFLTSPEGAFYASQDADLVPGEHSAAYFALDDAGRRAQGQPRVDTHVYARENGWAIAALAALYAVTGDDRTRAEAERAARWIIANRALPGGGFRHDASDRGGPYLGDTLAMARAGLALYTATGAREWLALARRGLDFIDARFAVAPAASVSAEGGAAPAGYLTTPAIPGGLPPTPQRDENLALARLANLVFHHTGDPAYRAMAARAFRYLAAPGIAERRPTAGVLVADAELASEPLHLTVVGRKDDPRAVALFRAATADPWVYKRVEWLDGREGPLPNPDVQLPTLAEPALFLCTGQRCSTPVTDPAAVRARIDRALGRPGASR